MPQRHVRVPRAAHRRGRRARARARLPAGGRPGAERAAPLRQDRRREGQLPRGAGRRARPRRAAHGRGRRLRGGADPAALAANARARPRARPGTLDHGGAALRALPRGRGRGAGRARRLLRDHARAAARRGRASASASTRRASRGRTTGWSWSRTLASAGSATPPRPCRSAVCWSRRSWTRACSRPWRPRCARRSTTAAPTRRRRWPRCAPTPRRRRTRCSGAHVDLYVNEATRDLGEGGGRALAALHERTAAAGLVPSGRRAPRVRG